MEYDYKSKKEKQGIKYFTESKTMISNPRENMKQSVSILLFLYAIKCSGLPCKKIQSMESFQCKIQIENQSYISAINSVNRPFILEWLATVWTCFRFQEDDKLFYSFAKVQNGKYRFLSINDNGSYMLKLTSTNENYWKYQVDSQVESLTKFQYIYNNVSGFSILQASKYQKGNCIVTKKGWNPILKCDGYTPTSDLNAIKIKSLKQT